MEYSVQIQIKMFQTFHLSFDVDQQRWQIPCGKGIGRTHPDQPAHFLRWRGAVADAESKVEQYRARNNLLVGTNNTTLNNQQLGEINSQVAAARGAKTASQGSRRRAKNKGAAAAAPLLCLC